MQEVNINNSEEQISQICEICCCEHNEDKVSLYNPSVICYNCWHEHIKASVGKISYKAGSQILSPIEGKPSLDICIALNSLKKEHATEIEEWLFKKYSSFTPDIEKCPSESCDYVFTMQKCKWKSVQDERCPKCEAGLIQSTGWDIKGILGFIYFVFLANKCPKCEIPIQKTTGCPHMTCPCGHQFCWYCLKDYYFNGNNVYSVHDPKECACIFISKIIVMVICVSGIVLTFLGNDFFHQFVSYFFIGLKYVIGAVAIDLVIIGNYAAVNQFIERLRSFRLYGVNYHGINPKMILAIMVFFDVMVLGLLYYLDLHMLFLFVVLVEVSIALFIIGTGFLIAYSVETWFEFIC